MNTNKEKITTMREMVERLRGTVNVISRLADELECSSASPTPANDPLGGDLCIYCEGIGKYPTGETCKSCGGSGRVLKGDGIPAPAVSEATKKGDMHPGGPKQTIIQEVWNRLEGPFGLCRSVPREIVETGVETALHILRRAGHTIQPTHARNQAEPVKWPNHCDQTVPQALRFLADHPRPSGGEQDFNSAHLYQLAGEIETMAGRPLYATPPSDAMAVVEEALTEARLQIEYLHEKAKATGSGNNVLQKIDAALAAIRAAR